MSKRTPPKRRQRPHGVLPAGFKWRDGRPRWDPSPTRRKQGWRAVDLKDAWGKWLAKGPAVTRAQAIADVVAAWAAGEAVPGAFVHFAPKGAAMAGAGPGALNPRSIGALLEGYYAHDLYTSLAARTQEDYRNKLNRFLEILARPADAGAGYVVTPERLAGIQAFEIDILLPPAFGTEGDFELERVYELLQDEAGLPMANGVHACVSAWLRYCVKKRRVWPSNPATLVERRVADGRIVVYDWPELVALVRHFDAKGLGSIGDAIILGVDLSWSPQDLLAMTWGQVAASFHVKHRRIKTGNAGNPRLLQVGQARLRQVRLRLGANVEPAPGAPVLVCELTGGAWNAHTFRHAFAEGRAEVAKDLPEVAFKQFRDLRDTSITYCYDAGLSLLEICSRTLHDPDYAQKVIDKHYGKISQSVADDAADKLDAHYRVKGYAFHQLLALPAPEGK